MEAAAAQEASLGFPARRMFIPHPIQDRTDDEMRALAQEAFRAVAALVTSAPQN